jgi:hypothetical protein
MPGNWTHPQREAAQGRSREAFRVPPIGSVNFRAMASSGGRLNLPLGCSQATERYRRPAHFAKASRRRWDVRIVDDREGNLVIGPSWRSLGQSCGFANQPCPGLPR